MRISSRLTPLLVLTTLLWCGALPASAQDTEDSQLWFQTLAIGQLSEEWRAHLELQPRLFNNGSELALTLVRTAVGRQVAPRLTLWLGHAWVPRTLGATTSHEQRIWQQASITLPSAGRWAATARARLEQRWLDPWDNASHRLRLLGRLQRPLGSSPRWSIAFYNETMVTLDTTRNGPARGFDRNRLYSGVIRRLSPAASIEVGHIWENSTIRGPAQRNDQVLIGVLNLAFSRR